MQITVLGGGIFGCTAALVAAGRNHAVTLVEPTGRLLSQATTHNQLRLHMGFHYPRSPETVRECLDGIQTFMAMYGQAACRGQEHLYAIAHGSLVDARTYQRFCLANGLRPLRLPQPPAQINDAAVEAVFQVPETALDLEVLSTLIQRRFRSLGVRVSQEPAGPKPDQTIIATYDNMNRVCLSKSLPTMPLQFEVCEKPLVRMPMGFGQELSIVVIDGPFCSIDPWNETGYHAIGHVEHAIWSRNVGLTPEIPRKLVGFMHNGAVRVPNSRWPQMKKAAAVFVPSIAEAEWVGSMFTVRAVLPDVEDTDARPTLVQRLDERHIRLFSGKIPTCVAAAVAALELAEAA